MESGGSDETTRGWVGGWSLGMDRWIDGSTQTPTRRTKYRPPIGMKNIEDPERSTNRSPDQIDSNRERRGRSGVEPDDQ